MVSARERDFNQNAEQIEKALADNMREIQLKEAEIKEQRALAKERLEREQEHWADAIEEAVHARLLEALLALGEASAANAAVLERQIDLSVEMIGAISTEAKRIAGRSTTTYGARGDISSFDAPVPIAVNSEY